jgi:hypothetical protein
MAAPGDLSARGAAKPQEMSFLNTLKLFACDVIDVIG